MRDAERLGVRNWRIKAKDRDGWRRLLESAKALHGSKRPGVEWSSGIYVRATCFDLVGHHQALQENRSKSCQFFCIVGSQMLTSFSYRSKSI